MKKIFTLIAVAMMALGAQAQDWNATDASQLPKETVLLDNDYAKIVTAVQDTEAALIKDTLDQPDPKTIAGYTFTKYVNIRVARAPAQDNNWEGTAHTDATPVGISLIVTTKKNTDMTLYYRHGDGKVLSCFDQTTRQNVANVETAVDNLASYYTGTLKLIGEHTYTIYATGGTTSLCGLSTAEGTYVEPSAFVYAYNGVKENLTTYGDGAKMQISGNTSKNFANGASITVDGAKYTGIKNSNGAQNTFTAPEGKKIYRMSFYAIPNNDGDEPKFTEFNGVTFETPILVTTTKDGNNPTETIMCGNGLESVTFTYGGKQVNFVVKVDYAESSYDAQYDPNGENAIKAVKTSNAKTAVVYNLAGQKVEAQKGIVIENGKKVVKK